MTIATRIVSTLRNCAAAALLATVAATTLLPDPALARDGLSERGLLAERAASVSKERGKVVMKCGYIKSKHKPYKTRHVKVKAYKTKVNCNEKHKGNLVIRSFRAEQSDKEIKKSVAKTANQYYG